MAYPTVDINAEDYNVYADLDTANIYAAAAIHSEDWDTATDAQKSKALVSATRTLDRQVWVGEKVDSAQALAWPRTNTGLGAEADGVDPAPANFIAACIELAIALINGSEVQNNQTTAERFRSISAGSVNISNFRGVDNPTRFPLIVQELLRPYLNGADTGTFAATATGVDAESIFPVDLGFNRGI